MKERRYLILLVLSILGFSLNAMADVPPDPGYKRVTQRLAVECDDGLSGYRFFIKSGADLKELHLEKGERQTIEPLGGGAWYRVGTLIAVPAKALSGLSETPLEGSKLNELQKAVYDGKAAGAAELLTHNFVRDVRVSEARVAGEAVYRIEPDNENGVRAVAVSGGTGEQGGAPEFTIYSQEVKTPLFWATVAGASLMTLPLISFGVWYVRRSRVV